MEDKIAVQCKTKKEWDAVKAKIQVKFPRWKVTWNSSYEDERMCITENEGLGGTGPGFSRLKYWKGRDYTIISAQEYLNEGGKDVSEFKVGDRVECIEPVSDVGDGDRGNIVKIVSDLYFIEWDDYNSSKHDCDGLAENGYGWNVNSHRIKLIGKSTKPKTTKESNMELNSSIRTVFVEEDNAAFDLVEKMQNVFGGEIAEDFTGAMILRNNKEEYLAEIKRLDDIEVKRLKEEAKKK